MSNPILVKAFVASEDIRPNRAVTLAADGKVREAQANTTTLGVCELGGKAGDTVDVVLVGIAEIILGGTTNIMSCVPVVAAVGGVAVTGTTALSLVNASTVIGKTVAAGDPGDIVPVLVNSF